MITRTFDLKGYAKCTLIIRGMYFKPHHKIEMCITDEELEILRPYIDIESINESQKSFPFLGLEDEHNDKQRTNTNINI